MFQSMRRGRVAGGAFATVARAPGPRRRLPGTQPAHQPRDPPASARDRRQSDAHPSFLYGRITTIDGVTYEGRLRWGGGQEAFWGDYFNGAKKENPWVAYVPPERLPKERRPIEIFGIKIAHREQPDRLRPAFHGALRRHRAHRGAVAATCG